MWGGVAAVCCGFFCRRVEAEVVGGVLNPPVAADVGEEVFRRGLVLGEAGEVEDGLGPGAPLAFQLVRGVPLGEESLCRVVESGALVAGQDPCGARLAPAARQLAVV